MNRITIDFALWIALLAGLAGAQHGNHTRLRLRAPAVEPGPVVCDSQLVCR